MILHSYSVLYTNLQPKNNYKSYFDVFIFLIFIFKLLVRWFRNGMIWLPLNCFMRFIFRTWLPNPLGRLLRKYLARKFIYRRDPLFSMKELLYAKDLFFHNEIEIDSFSWKLWTCESSWKQSWDECTLK